MSLRVIFTGTIAGILVIAGIIVIVRQFGAEHPTMTTEETERLITQDSTTLLLDVRTEPEFDGPLGHLRGALLIPVQELRERLDELEPYRERTIIVYCRTGNRSGHATRLLREQGFAAWNMAGGMVRWNAEGRAKAENGRNE